MEWTGNEFQAAGPATVNELSANRVLVHHRPHLTNWTASMDSGLLKDFLLVFFPLAYSFLFGM